MTGQDDVDDELRLFAKAGEQEAGQSAARRDAPRDSAEAVDFDVMTQALDQVVATAERGLSSSDAAEKTACLERCVELWQGMNRWLGACGSPEPNPPLA